MVIIIIGVVVVLLVLWVILCQRRLAVMDENINNTMTQISVQLSSCFDALTALLDLTRRYASYEAQTLDETIRIRRSDITVTSTPDDVLRQEGVIIDVLSRIFIVAERHPELKTDENYAKCRNAVDSYENMVRISYLIYNDSVTRLNRELRMFPVSLIAGALGFRQKDVFPFEG